MIAVDDDPALPHVLSLGAGVQSSTLALMAAHGEVKPMPTLAIFADTGWEPRRVYGWQQWLVEQLPFPVVTVKAGDIRSDTLRAFSDNPGGRWASMPYFLDNDGTKGIVRRQCTREYKIDPILTYIKRHVLGIKFRGRTPKDVAVVQWMGISWDERRRATQSFERWKDHRYPLIELKMTRGHCLEWLEAHGYPEAPRSACIGCPYHSDAEWIRMRNEKPEEFADAVAFDAQIRSGKGPIKGIPYLHASLQPLNEVEFSTAESEGQLDMFGEECAGMCGV